MATMITNAGMVLITNTAGNVTWSTQPQPQEWHPVMKDFMFTSLAQNHEVEVEFE